MKRRIIINIEHDNLSDERVIALVGRIIENGRVSNTAGRKHYCHISHAGFEDTMVHATRRNDTTDTFTIWKGTK